MVGLRPGELARPGEEAVKPSLLRLRPGSLRVLERRGRGIVADLLVAERVQHLRSVGLVDLRLVLIFLVGQPVRTRTEHGGGGRGAGEQAAQDRDRGPVSHSLLGRTQALASRDRFAAVGQHVFEELQVVGREVVARFRIVALGEGRLVAEPGLHVLAPALDHVRQQHLFFERHPGTDLKVGIQEPEERAKAFLDAAVRGRGDQDDVAVRVLGDRAQQFVALVLDPAGAAGRPGRHVRLVHDDEVRGAAQEWIAVSLRLHEIDAGDQVRIVLVDRDILARQAPLQARDLRGLNEHRLERKFLAQLTLPLVTEVGRTEHGQAPGKAAVEQLAGDHRRLDGLSHAHVVGNQQAHGILP